MSLLQPSFVSSPSLTLLAVRSSEYDVNAVSRLGKEVAVAGTSSGELLLSRFPSTEGTKLKRIRAHVSAVSSLCFVPAGAGGAARDSLCTAGGNELTIFYWRLRNLKTDVERDVLSALNNQRGDDIQRLSALLPSSRVSDASAVRAALVQTSEPWRCTMLRPRLDMHHDGDVIGGWGSSFSRIALKDLDIRLDRVHGYRGYDCRGNILTGPDGLLVWFVGRVVVVMGGVGARQRFYLQHFDDVACIAKFQPLYGMADGYARNTDEGAEEESATIMASGEVGDAGEVHIWDTLTLTCKARLVHGFAVRHVSFGPHDSTLLSVGGNDHACTLTLWDWSNQYQLAHLTNTHNVPFLDVKCNPYYETQGGEHDQIWAATCGPHGVTFWAVHPPKEGGKHSLVMEEGSLHHVSDHSQDPMAICTHFISSRILVTGRKHPYY